jgi:hypothetical protein
VELLGPRELFEIPMKLVIEEVHGGLNATVVMSTFRGDNSVGRADRAHRVRINRGLSHQVDR